jgi:lipopolysaccharide export system permease protein
MIIKLTPVLNVYFAKLYARNLFMMIGGLLAVIYLFDTIEILRRGARYSDVTLGLVLQMGFLKLPEAGQIILPFAVLFSAILTFWQLNRRHELVVVRAAGLSVWQFLAPVIAVAVGFGVLQMMVINPASSLMLSKFSRLEDQFLARKTSHMVLFKEGLWLRQASENGTVVLHANKVDVENWALHDVMALYINKDLQFEQRLDAPSADLIEGEWVFKNPIINKPRAGALKLASVSLPTDITGKEIEDSFSSPETLSFWAMPNYIQTMEATGFDSSRLRVHYYSLWAQPLLYLSMILLAATIALRPPRMGMGIQLLGAAIFMSFVIFFMGSFLQALGGSHQIPAFLAAWTPAVVTFLLGVAIILNLEDG